MPLTEEALRISGKRTSITYSPRGNIARLFEMRDPAIVLDGPAGTGKSRGILEKVHLCLIKYPGARALMFRKTRKALSETGMWTYENKVLHKLDQIHFKVTEQKYIYPNNSEFLVAGMDDAEKVKSMEIDLAYGQEITECSQKDWDLVSSRLRNGVMPYQQLLGDCNPDDPNHWLKKAQARGHLKMLQTAHQDNPVLWDQENQCWTEKGLQYISRLDQLDGVRLKRLRYGLWVGAEGVVYDQFDRELHICERFPIPRQWPRYWVVDFGFKDPFVWLNIAESPEGIMYLDQQIYMTGRTVEDHAVTILDTAAGQPKPQAIICDHDLEDRMTLERHLQMSTIPAYKAILPGIEAVKARLRVHPILNCPTFQIMQGSLVEVDNSLVEEGKPHSTEDEFSSYTWPEEKKINKKDVPIDRWNHGMDAMRYAVAFVDSISVDPTSLDNYVYQLDDMDRVRISDY